MGRDWGRRDVGIWTVFCWCGLMLAWDSQPVTGFMRPVPGIPGMVPGGGMGVRLGRSRRGGVVEVRAVAPDDVLLAEPPEAIAKETASPPAVPAQDLSQGALEVVEVGSVVRRCMPVWYHHYHGPAGWSCSLLPVAWRNSLYWEPVTL
jgi:hypothetical protein